LYYTYVKYPLVDTQDAKYFNVDHIFSYQNFAGDFGPLNISHTYRFCFLLKSLLEVKFFFFNININCKHKYK